MTSATSKATRITARPLVDAALVDAGGRGAAATARHPNGSANKVAADDRAVHGWYRFVLSFPPHLVADYLSAFNVGPDMTVLDPFCGTGTTLVEAKKQGIPSIGIEANPFAVFASEVKTDWQISPVSLLRNAEEIVAEADRTLRAMGIDDESDCSDLCGGPFIRKLTPDQNRLLLTNSISAMPLHKAIVLSETIGKFPALQNHCKLAFADALVGSISNLEFGPEVGVGNLKKDVPVIRKWLDRVRRMADDIEAVCQGASTSSRVRAADARNAQSVLGKETIDAVITSPPYPNEKDYTRTTRLESVLLGFIHNKVGLRELKGSLVRSNTRNVYKKDDDDRWVSDNQKVQEIANCIEDRRLELGKTSGFERMYPRVVTLYFGGMTRHLAGLRETLRPGAKLAYVVGDQASYLRIMIRTGTLLAEIAEGLGYQVRGLELFRTRLATATREQLREEALLLEWNGGSNGRCYPV